MFEIGNSLREARERQGLGYPEIELATKIRAKYIRALEEEDFTSIPGDAYIRGFLRTYADYLGLDGDVYVDEYASRFITSWRDELPPRPERRRIRARTSARAAGRPARARRHRRRDGPRLRGVQPSRLVARTCRDSGRITSAQSAPARQLVLHGVGRGHVRRGAPQQGFRQGRPASDGEPGQTDRLAGDHFYLLVRTPAGLHITLDGRAVALPAVHNLRVLVTPQRTTRLRG